MQRTDETPTETQVGDPLTLKDLSEVLIKHYGLHEGLYNLSVEFTIGVGPVGAPGSIVPGAMIGVQKIGLIKASEMGPSTIDAAVINPPKKSKKK